MAKQTTTLHLNPQFFSELEKPLVESGSLKATAFRFSSGVCGLRLQNELGELVLLPFQGQQIWSATFGGRNLTMRAVCTEPRPGVPFLETFGGFLQHCGVMGVGGPSPKDTHPLHGELPNAPYQKAHLVIGEDEKGAYIGMGGTYQHTVTFNTSYLAQPLVKLYAGSSVFSVEMTITNLKASEMDLMYLAHINFKPVDHSRLVYSALYTPEHVRVRTSIPSHIIPKPGYKEFLDVLKDHPEKHHILSPDLLFDPEVAIFIDYLPGQDGWAHSMQVHPGGTADYVSHRPDQLPKATRWLCRTPDQDAMALIEPATAEPEGYLTEKAKGNLKILPPKGQYHCQMIIGALQAEEAKKVEQKIKQITGAQ
jgi:hypothetical protein